MEQNRLIVALLLVAIILSVVSLTVTLSMDSQPLEDSIAERQTTSDQSADVTLEILPRNESEVEENEES